MSEVTVEDKRAILELLRNAEMPVGIGEIVVKLKMSYSSVLRHLASLQEEGLIRESAIESRKFVLTPEGRSVVAVLPIALKREARKILRIVHVGKSFYFYTGIDRYTGVFASSLSDFCDVIKTIDLDSIRFHLKRGDFEAWIRDVLGDMVLANRIKELEELALEGEELRARLYSILRTRYEELRRACEE